jgi:hypothetical protein
MLVLDPVTLALLAAKGVAGAVKFSKATKGVPRREQHATDIWEVLRIPGARLLELGLVDRREALDTVSMMKEYAREQRTSYEKYALLSEGFHALWRAIEKQNEDFRAEAIAGALFVLLIQGNAAVESSECASWQHNELPVYLSLISGKELEAFLGHTSVDREVFGGVIDPLWRATGRWRKNDDNRPWARSFKHRQTAVFPNGPHPELWPDPSNTIAHSLEGHTSALPMAKVMLPHLKIKGTETYPFRKVREYHLLQPLDGSTWASCMYIKNALRALTFDSLEEDQAVIFHHPYDHAFARWLQKPMGLKLVQARDLDGLEEQMKRASAPYWSHVRNWLFVFPPANKDVPDHVAEPQQELSVNGVYFPLGQKLSSQPFVVCKNFSPSEQHRRRHECRGNVVNLSNCNFIDTRSGPSPGQLWFKATCDDKTRQFPTTNILPIHDPATLRRADFVGRTDLAIVTTQEIQEDQRMLLCGCSAGRLLLGWKCYDENWWKWEPTGQWLSWEHVAIVNLEDKRWRPWLRRAVFHCWEIRDKQRVNEVLKD